MLKLLIVDDHPIVISGVRALLEEHSDIEVAEAHDADTALALAAQSPPDVAVIDVNLPGSSGFALVQKLLEKDTGAKVIMFSMNDDPVFVAQAMGLGAKGFISKNGNPAGMLEAIREVANGGTSWPEGSADRIAFLSGAGGSHGLPFKLSARELEILALLAKGRSMSEIADHVGVSYKTVAGTCAGLRTRIGARTQMELVRIAVERRLV